MMDQSFLDEFNTLGLNFTEVFTATEGQTVINLTNSYPLGKGVLNVEIDGVKQFLNSGYTETTTNSITIAEPLVAGQKVKVIIRGLEPTEDARLNSLTASLADKATQDASFLLNVLYPPKPLVGAKGNGVTDDTAAIQALLDYANTNGLKSVYFPPTTNGYAINGQLNLYSGTEVFGKKTKIISASNAALTNLFRGNALTNIKLRSFRFFSTNDKTKADGRNGLASNIIAVSLSGCAGIECEDLFGDQLEYLVKIDSTSSGLRLVNLETTNTHQPLYIGTSSDIFLDKLILGCPTETNTDSLDHAVYLAFVTNLQAGHIVCKQGNGYAIQISNVAGNVSKNLTFENVVLSNVRAGILASTSKGVQFGNVVIDGITSSGALTKAVTSSADSDLLVENLKIYNIGNLQGGAIFNTDATTSGVLKVMGGFIDNSGTNVIAQLQSNGDLYLNDIVFNLCEGRFASSTSAAHRNLFVKGCKFIRNAAPSGTTPASIELFRLQATAYAEIEGNTFINTASNARAIIWCTDNTGVVVAKNNTIKGDSVLISPSDTKTKGANNFDANNNRVDSFVQNRIRAAGEGIVLTTPDGTKVFKIAIDNAGVVTSTATT
jgi:hypothetical protein